MKAASGVYEVLIPVDQNLPYQQSIAGLNIAILILTTEFFGVQVSVSAFNVAEPPSYSPLTKTLTKSLRHFVHHVQSVSSRA